MSMSGESAARLHPLLAARWSPTEFDPSDVVTPGGGRVAARGGAVGAVGRELPAVGVHRRAPRRSRSRAPGAIPDQELGEVGRHRRGADRESVASLRRGHRLGVLGVLAVRPRPGGRPHVVSGAIAGIARAPVPGVRSRGAGRRVRGAAALGGDDDVGHRPDSGHGRSPRPRGPAPRDRRRHSATDIPLAASRGRRAPLVRPSRRVSPRRPARRRRAASRR